MPPQKPPHNGRGAAATGPIVLPVERVAVLSTGHVTKEDCEKLDQDFQRSEHALIVYVKDEYGFWVYVPSDQAVFAETHQNAQQAGYSEAFLHIFTLARNQGCIWLMLDRDAEQIDGLPQFDW